MTDDLMEAMRLAYGVRRATDAARNALWCLAGAFLMLVLLVGDLVCGHIVRWAIG